MRDEIVEYILANEQNLKTATAVADAWPAVRRKAAEEFMGRLESRLKPALDGWKFQRSKVPYVDSWAGFYLWKPKWNDSYGLSLQWSGYGTDGKMGVYRESPKEVKLPRCSGLLELVQQIFPSATANKWWEVRIVPAELGKDWTTSEALWRLARDEGLSNEIADALLEIARIAEPILDKAVQRIAKHG